MMKRLTVAAVLLMALMGLAEASCVTQPYRFNLPENQTVTTAQTVDQQGCETGFGIGADARNAGTFQTSFDSITIVRRPQHLVIAPTSNGFGYSIAVKGGYRGLDAYTMRACGSSRLGKGCVTVNFNVRVE